MENYNNEREHDLCLISLVTVLDEAGRLDIFRNAFRIEEDLGPLRWSGRRRAFDVELEFTNLSVAIETKVHSDEGGRWCPPWQTERIAEQRREVRGLCFFITYGTSEFYMKPCTKPYEAGPASPEFQHIPLERMIHLVESSLAALPQIKQCTDSVEWLQLMRLEKEKREKAQELLHSFAQFRTRYLEVHGENDFPRGRVAFSAPELAFPDMGFFETGGSLKLGHHQAKKKAELDEEQKEKIWKRLCGAKWPSDVNACRRDYRQNALVLYEVDFGFLANVECLSKVVSNLGCTLKVIFGALNNDRE